jgi:ATPase subunit of ABC transporter with duplicated ATPase domains
VGKTTLLRLLLEKGKWAEKARIGYWPQDAKDEFVADEPLTEWMSRWRRKDRGDDDQIVRATLGQLLFSGDDQKKSVKVISGGEAQRMKLAAHLQPRTLQAPDSEAHKRRPRVLYLFDEPTTGLHFDDVAKLLTAFRRLIDAGGSVLVIEHNLDVIRTADWVIDLGPEGGDRGGEVVAVGPPETIARCARSYTGQWLARTFEGAAPSSGNGSGRRSGKHLVESDEPVRVS